MADTDKTAAALLDELAALEQAERRKVTEELRKVSETFADVPDGRHIAQEVAPQRKVGWSERSLATADGVVRIQ